MKRKVVVIISVLLIVIGVLLVDRIGRDNSEDIKDNFENTIQGIEDQERSELPLITSTEQTNKETEEINSNDNIGVVSGPDEENNSSDVSSNEEKSTSTEKNQETTGQTESENEKTDTTIPDDETHMELPFVPAN